MVKAGDIAKVIKPFGDSNINTLGQLVRVINVREEDICYAEFKPLAPSAWRGPAPNKIKTWAAFRLEKI